MTADRANLLDQIDALIEVTRANLAALHTMIRLATEHLTPLERPVQQPFNASETRDEILAARRRAHVPGSPSKIDTDPELRAFIIARIDRLKFTEIRDEIRTHFPPDRHTSLSALSRWWQREGQFLPPQSQDTG